MEIYTALTPFKNLEGLSIGEQEVFTESTFRRNDRMPEEKLQVIHKNKKLTREKIQYVIKENYKGSKRLSEVLMNLVTSGKNDMK